MSDQLNDFEAKRKAYIRAEMRCREINSANQNNHPHYDDANNAWQEYENKQVEYYRAYKQAHLTHDSKELKEEAEKNRFVVKDSDKINYVAPKPSKSSSNWYLLFPPLLLWVAVKATFNLLAGSAIGKGVLPAQTFFLEESAKNDWKYNLNFYLNNKENRDAIVYNLYKIKTHDSAILESIEIKPNSLQDQISKQCHIINFFGNGQCYQGEIKQMIEDSKKLQANVIGFNYRGVFDSSGKLQCANDLVTDGIAQVQRRLDEGAKPENIFLKGHSLGGGVATLVAKHFHEKGIHVNLFNGRSFSSITNFIVGQLRTGNLTKDELSKSGHKESTGGKILGWLVKPVIKFILALTKWEMNVVNAYKSIPQENKRYMVVKSTKDIRRGAGVDDTVITDYASLHKGLKPERKRKKDFLKILDTFEGTLTQMSARTEKPGYNQNALEKHKRALFEQKEVIQGELKEIKSAKMTAKKPEENGHNTNELVYRDNTHQSHVVFFHQFVEKTMARALTASGSNSPSS